MGPQTCHEEDEEAEHVDTAWTWGNMKKLERLSRSSITEARLCLRNMIFSNLRLCPLEQTGLTRCPRIESHERI